MIDEYLVHSYLGSSPQLPGTDVDIQISHRPYEFLNTINSFVNAYVSPQQT
jgi:hypothetical protein